MKIDSYSFGQMIIDGKKYTTDVIVYPDRIDPSWWREAGHSLQVKDLAEVLARRPAVLLIGTGFAGVMRVPEGVRSHVRSFGIELHIDTTGRMAEAYNKAPDKHLLIAAFHLTC